MPETPPSEPQNGPSERQVDTDWYSACLVEVRGLVEALADSPEITIHREDESVAALLGVLQGAGFVALAQNVLNRLS